MTRQILVAPFAPILLLALAWLTIGAEEVRPSNTITPSVPLAPCFQNNELDKSLTTLKRQSDPDVRRVFLSLLSKAKSTPRCRTQLVQALIRSLDQASDPKKSIENYFLWENGASMLAELKATEALDLLVANLDFGNGFESSVADFPALMAIVKIGAPAIPKLQIVLTNDPIPHRRKFAAYSIIYIGGSQAGRALTSALPLETDPCVKKLLQLYVQGFDSKRTPKQTRLAVNGKWIAAFHCM